MAASFGVVRYGFSRCSVSRISVRSRGSVRGRIRTREENAHRDVPGLTMCPRSPPALRSLPHIVIPGNPREGRRKSAVPVQNEAAARAGSVVAFLPINPRTTTLHVRRWDAWGVPEGRGRGRVRGSGSVTVPLEPWEDGTF